MESIQKPNPEEYAPFYAGYVARVEGDPLALLRNQARALEAGCAGLTEAEALHRYESGKWSVKQVIGHMTDAERIFAYRLLRVGRGDSTPLSPFDENAYVDAAGFDARPLTDLLEDFGAARANTLRLADGMAPTAWIRWGTASGSPVSARGILYIIAGHAEHHMALLRERYGVGVPVDLEAVG